MLAILWSLPSFANDLHLPPLEGDWEPTLIEEFDRKKLDKNVWNKSLLWGGGHGSSIYKNDHISVENGKLLIKTSNQSGKDPNGKKFKFTSGLIHSFSKFTQKYGYFEIKMKVEDTIPGLWPAFWLMPDRRTKNKNRFPWYEDGRRSTSIVNFHGEIGKGMEIDIMEHLTIWGPNRFHQAAHWDDYGKDHKSIGNTISLSPSIDGYRKFGLLWEKGTLVWFVDDIEVFRFENERVADVPMYLKVNVATGGWDGNHLKNTEQLPVYTEIEYVRVWKRVSH